MKRLTVLLSLLACLTFNSIKAQDMFPVLTLNPDPNSLALGMGGVVNVNSDPGDYYYNPALLGYFSQRSNLSYQTYSTIPDWGHSSGTKLNTNSFTAGYRSDNVFKGLNISAGFGYRRFNVGYGVNGYSSFDAYSFGLSLDYLVNLSFGITFKNASARYNSTLVLYPNVNAKATDWGLLLNVPVLKLIDPGFTYKPGSMELKPYANFSLGYSKSNSGDEYEYTPGQTTPLPLTARLGYNLSVGSDIKILGESFQLLDLSLMIEARDLLLEYNPYSRKPAYQSGLGDINITENLLKWKATDKTEISKGKSITLLETVSLLRGSVHFEGSKGLPTNGYAVSSGGIFKLLSLFANNENPYIKYVLNHLEFKYVNASISYADDYMAINRNLSSLSVSVKNISF